MTELGEIPEEWSIKKLNDISELIDGDRSSRYPGDRDIVECGILFLSTQNIVNSKLVYDNCKFITENKFNELSKGKLEENDLVITLRGSIGNVAKFNGDAYDTGFINAQLMIIRSNNINPDYLNKYLISTSAQKQINNISSGSAQPQLTKGDLKTLKIIIPTKEEQEKIASILSTVDEQIDNTEKLIQKNQELKKGLMQQLLTKGIGHTKFKKTEIGEIPEEWEVKKIDDLMQYMKSGLSRNLKDDDIGIPCIRSNNIVDSKIDNKDLKYWYLEDDKGADIKEYILEKGDVLVNFINSMSQIGKTCIYRDIGRPAIYTTNIFRIKMNQVIMLNKYFYYFTQTEIYKKEIGLITKPAVNQASFTTGDFKGIRLAVPPVNEQEKIASILLSVDEKIEEYQNKKEKLEELKKGLMQQLLTGKIRVI